jgi:hypothetical protein
MTLQKDRILVTLPAGIDTILEKDLLGLIGDNKSEVVRNIVISYLSDKGYFNKSSGRHSGGEKTD